MTPPGESSESRPPILHVMAGLVPAINAPVPPIHDFTHHQREPRTPGPNSLFDRKIAERPSNELRRLVGMDSGPGLDAEAVLARLHTRFGLPSEIV